MKTLNAFLLTAMISTTAHATAPNVNCRDLASYDAQETEILELIQTAAAVNEPILRATERHTDKIVEFMRNMENMSHYDTHTLPIQFLNLIASLADSAEGNRIVVSMDEQMALLNELSRVLLGEPNFLDTLDRSVRPQVQEIIDSVDTLEVSHRTRGSYKGEARIKLNTKNNRSIRLDFVAIGRELGVDLPMEEMIIEDGAEILFNDSEVDHRGRHKRDDRIIDLVENATTRDFGGMQLITEQQVDRTIEIIENRDYRSNYQPIYFRAEGIRVKSEYLGLGGKVSQGVVIPHIREDSNREAPKSLFLQVKATGMLGLASIAGATVAL